MIEQDLKFFKDHFPAVRVTEQASPSHGTPIYNTNITREYPTHSAGGAFGSAVGVGIGPAMHLFRTSQFTTEQHFGSLGIQGGIQRIKNQQLEVLEQLKHEHQELRKMQRNQTVNSSKVSEASSSSVASSSVQASKHSAAHATLQRRLEQELSQKTRRIEELLLSERDLQKTIHNLKVELDRKSAEEPDLAATIKKLKVSEADLTEKYLREIESYKADTERFILENTRLKKQLLNKDFELKALIQENARRASASEHSRVARSSTQDLRDQLIQCEEKISWLEGQLSHERETSRRFQQRISDLQSRLSSKQQEQFTRIKPVVSAVSEADFNKIKRQLEEQRLNVVRKENQIKRLEEQNASYIEKLARAKGASNDNSDLKQEIVELRRLVAERNSNHELHDKIISLTKEIAQLHTQVRNKQHAHDISLVQLEELKRKLDDNSKYISQLEETLANSPPKRPAIFENQDWPARERELNEIISKYREAEEDWNRRVVNYQERLAHQDHQLEIYRHTSASANVSAVEEYENRIKQMQMEWARRQVEYEQRIAELERHEKNKYEGEISSLKEYIKQIVEVGQEDLKLKTTEFESQMESLKLMNNQNTETIRLEFKGQLDKLSSLHKETEDEKRTYMDQVGELQMEVATLTRELNSLKASRNGEKAILEAEIARITQDSVEWKRRFEIEVRKAVSEREELTRLFNEKYDRDLAALKSLNQRLMQQNQQLIPLQGQLQQLTGMNRQLYSEVRERSQAIDHLWQVKLAEYENVHNQLQRLKTRMPPPAEPAAILNPWSMNP